MNLQRRNTYDARLTYTALAFTAHFFSGRALSAAPDEEATLRLNVGLRRVLWIGLVVSTIPAGSASAQVTPAAGSTPPDDTPSIRLGATFYGDYTFTKSPEATDADGNTIHPSTFNVGRSYINITGNISHLVAFRLTPDITRAGSDSGAVLNGNLLFRVKYAFMQVNLDDWMPQGSWTRLGIQQTPWVDFEENIYRYRFQGTVFAEREGFMSSSDAGASFRYNLPSNYGEIHAGVYNGENYNRAEPNDQKAFEIRGTVRPLATSPALALRGLRAHLFVTRDHAVKNADRMRLLGSVTFEHPYLNAGFDYLKATDQTLAASPVVEGRGYSIWATPRSPTGWEGLLRYDHLTPNTGSDAQARKRMILGIAYWFPHQGTVSSAVLFDYDGQTFKNISAPKQQRIAVHGLVNF